MDKENFLQLNPSITRYQFKIRGTWGFAIQDCSQKEEMIEAGAVALMYEA